MATQRFVDTQNINYNDRRKQRAVESISQEQAKSLDSQQLALKSGASLPKYDTSTIEGQIAEQRDLLLNPISQLELQKKQIMFPERRTRAFIPRAERTQTTANLINIDTQLKDLGKQQADFETQVAKTAPETTIPKSKPPVYVAAKDSIQTKINNLSDSLNSKIATIKEGGRSPERESELRDTIDQLQAKLDV